MAIITPKNTLNEIITSRPEIIPLINRFGIILGIGDNTVESICKEKNLDCDFFTMILNTYLNENFFPEKTLKSFHVKVIINYISQTYIYYINYMIPNIERHFNLLISNSGNNNNLKLMQHFFSELKNDIKEAIEFDIDKWFPSILSSREKHTKHIANNNYFNNNSIIEDKINDLKSMFFIHLNGKYDLNLCYAVITAIVAFEKDFKQNNRIRNRILSPIYT